MQTTVGVQWDIHVESGRHICSGAYVSNVKCMHTSGPCNIVDYTEFIWGTYTDIFVSYMHTK